MKRVIYSLFSAAFKLLPVLFFLTTAVTSHAFASTTPTITILPNGSALVTVAPSVITSAPAGRGVKSLALSSNTVYNYVFSTTLNKTVILGGNGYIDPGTCHSYTITASPVVAPKHGVLNTFTTSVTLPGDDDTCPGSTVFITEISYTWTDTISHNGDQDSFTERWTAIGYGTIASESFLATIEGMPDTGNDIGASLGNPDDNPGDVRCGNPCSLGSGNKYQPVTDYTSVGRNRLSYVRYYNSLADSNNTLATELGPNWSATYDRYLDISDTGVKAQRADGQILSFKQADGVWSTKSDSDITLTGNAGTWTLTDKDDTVETYTELSSGEAILQKIVSRDGYTQTLAYNSDMLPVSVTDSYGRKLTFTYNTDGKLTQVKTPDALVLSYTYDPSGMLLSVSYNTSPSTGQIYAYVNGTDLASITDENGEVFASWTYDDQHRALTSQHADGAELVTLSYDSDTTRTATNALGQKTTYDFTILQGVPKITTITRTASSTVPAGTESFTYDDNGYTASKTDWNGNVTNYVNDANGNPTAITEAAGTPQARTTSISYAGPRSRQPGTITLPRETIAFTYDASGNVLTRTETDTSGGASNGQSRTWSFTYDDTGHVLTATNPLGAVTTYTYTGDNVATVTDALGHVSKITSYNGSGQPLSMTDPNGVLTSFTYDTRNRLLSRTVHDASDHLPAEDAVTGFAYDAAGNLTAISLPDSSQLLYTYDDAHRLVAVKNSAGESINYTLDADDNIIQQQLKGTSIAKTQTAVFDSLGRMLKQIGAYNDATAYTYDANGNALSITDALNNSTTRSFDALNRLIGSVDPLHNATGFAYDAQNNLDTVTDPRNLVTSYTYNGFGEVIAQTSPDTGTTAYTLDAMGNRIAEQDARGVATHRTFDKLNRALTETYAESADNVAYTYDTGAFGIGRLTGFSDRSGSTAFTYDWRGNILTDKRKIGHDSYVTSYAYDLADNLVGITYPDGRAIQYVRDAAGRISGVTLQGQGRGDDDWRRLCRGRHHRGSSDKTLVSNVTYEPFGPVNGMVFGNGVAARLSHDQNYRLTGIAAQGSGRGANAIQSLTMVYDGVGDITSITDFTAANDNDHDNGHDNGHGHDNNGHGIGLGQILGRGQDNGWGHNDNGGQPLSQSQTFTYDADRRLLTAIGAYGSESYTYDGDGNRTSEADAQGRQNAGSSYAYPATSNRLTSVSSAMARAYTYDANGNTLTETAPDANNWYAQNFAYDSRNRNTEVSTRDGRNVGRIQYLYNALGERVAKDRDGAGHDHGFLRDSTQFIYDEQGMLIAEAQNGRVTKDYVYINGLPVAVLDGNAVYYIHTDHLGTPQKMTDDHQQVVWNRVAKPFGETLETAGNVTLNLRFPGQYHDDETGLDYNFFRSYNPATGRYTQSDPIGLLGGINTYGFALQNPVNFFDAKGRNWNGAIQGGIIGTLFGFAVGGPPGALVGLINGAQAGSNAEDMYAERDIARAKSGVCTANNNSLSSLLFGMVRVNKMQPYIGPNGEAAVGPHTTFKIGPNGNITGYQTWNEDTSPGPNAWAPGIRYRAEGKTHGGILPPYVTDPETGARPATPNEIPGFNLEE